MLKQDHKNAISVIKTAVGAYAKDPSDRNAEQVEAALQTVKRLQAASNWRRPDEDQ